MSQGGDATKGVRMVKEYGQRMWWRRHEIGHLERERRNQTSATLSGSFLIIRPMIAC